MIKNVNKLSILAFAVVASALFVTNSAYAHVAVKPAEVVTAGFETFTMGVPNERETPTTKLKLLIPEGMKFVSPTQKAGWNISVEKSGNGEDAVVKSITWTGGTVNSGFRDEFTFSGKVPETATELKWKAYQTYESGVTVAWDQETEKESEGERTSGPLSITKVVAQTEDQTALQNVSKKVSESKDAADFALYTAAASILIGAGGVYLATRKKA